VDEQKEFDLAFASLTKKYDAVVVDFATAASEIGYASSAAAYTARARGKFPLRVATRSGALVVTVVEIARFATTAEPTAAAAAAGPRRAGRPTKTEQMRRAAESEK